MFSAHTTTPLVLALVLVALRPTLTVDPRSQDTEPVVSLSCLPAPFRSHGQLLMCCQTIMELIVTGRPP